MYEQLEHLHVNTFKVPYSEPSLQFDTLQVFIQVVIYNARWRIKLRITIQFQLLQHFIVFRINFVRSDIR